MKEKVFDCVQMKSDIQQRLLKEMAGLSLEERRRRLEDQVAANPILKRLWREGGRGEPSGKATSGPKEGASR